MRFAAPNNVNVAKRVGHWSLVHLDHDSRCSIEETLKGLSVGAKSPARVETRVGSQALLDWEQAHLNTGCSITALQRRHHMDVEDATSNSRMDASQATNESVPIDLGSRSNLTSHPLVRPLCSHTHATR
jgi:hypothetical protein